MAIETLLQRALGHERRSEWSEAFRIYGSAASLAPTDHRILANQGNAAWLAGEPDAALDAYRRALLLSPRCGVALRGLGNVLRDLGKFAAAHRAYTESRELDPNPVTAWNHSQVLIGLERYGEAYEAAERRFEVQGHEVHRQSPYWEGDVGSLVTAKTPLRIWSEQGLGDTLQYLRWIPLLCQLLPAGCSAPILEVEAALVDLVEHGLSWLEPAPKAIAKPDPAEIPPAEQHLSLLSLPHRLGGAPHPCQQARQGYLRHPGWPFSRNPSRLKRVGLVWASGRKLDDPFQAREYHQRSLPHDALLLLLEGLQERGMQVVNLQVGPDRILPVQYTRFFVSELPATMDFAATARFIADLELVITVDTAMAHLVGALGRSDWVLLPFTADPRWHRHVTHTPWYPNLRLFRQPAPGDWISVIRKVLADIEGHSRAWCQVP